MKDIKTKKQMTLKKGIKSDFHEDAKKNALKATKQKRIKKLSIYDEEEEDNYDRNYDREDDYKEYDYDKDDEEDYY